MKKLLLLSILLIISIVCDAQVAKFKTEAFNTKFSADSITALNQWVGWEQCFILVALNLHESTLDVYSTYEQHYDILSVENSIIRPNVIGIQFDALDKEGARCNIELLFYELEGKHHLYIRWKNLEVLYQMRKL